MPSEFNRFFRFCPACGADAFSERAPNLLRCGGCDFTFYRNPAVAVAAILTGPDGRVLMIRRGRQPAQGMLALPGGFVDLDETAEQALARELREELGLQAANCRYLATFPNRYHYGDVLYKVLDLFFTGEVGGSGLKVDADEVAGVEWLRPAEVQPERLAFPSMRLAWEFYLRHRRKSGLDL